MIVHRASGYDIFFGDAQTSFISALYKGHAVLTKEPFSRLNAVGLSQMVFLSQVHGVAGKAVSLGDASHALPSFVHEGDYLVTDVLGIGIGVATADCLPIVMVDQKKAAIGIAHAGWRGTLAGVTASALNHMQRLYGTVLADIVIYYGPCAMACCYQVQRDFVTQLKPYAWADRVITSRDNKLFFDVSQCNIELLKELDIQEHQINRSYQHCTIHESGFCSVRNSPGTKERQMTVVALNNSESLSI